MKKSDIKLNKCIQLKDEQINSINLDINANIISYR